MNKLSISVVISLFFHSGCGEVKGLPETDSGHYSDASLHINDANASMNDANFDAVAAVDANISFVDAEPADASCITPDSLIFHDLKTVGTGTYTVLNLDEFIVTGYPTVVQAYSTYGIGVQGGTGFGFLDGAEALTFDLKNPSDGIIYGAKGGTDRNDNGIPGEAEIEAFNADCTSLGVRAVSGDGAKDVSAMFGEVPISKVVVRAREDAHRVEYFRFNCLSCGCGIFGCY